MEFGDCSEDEHPGTTSGKGFKAKTERVVENEVPALFLSEAWTPFLI